MSAAAELGKVFAVVRSDEQWRRAIRDRADALGYTRRSISIAAGLTESYAERILAPEALKPISEMTRYALTGAVELEVVLRTAKQRNYPADGGPVVRKAKISAQSVRLGRILSLRFLRRIAKKGGKARWPKDPRKRSALGRKLAKIQNGKLTPQQRSERARHMNEVRWADVKAAAATEVARAPSTSPATAPPTGARSGRPARSGGPSSATRPAAARPRMAKARAGAKPR